MVRVLESWSGTRPVKTTPVDSGVNSRSVRAEMPDGKTYLVKSCIEIDGAYQNRLRNEFESLSFLWERGEKRIPQPFHFDTEVEMAVYGWVNGGKIRPQEIREEDVKSAFEFYVELQDYSSKKLGTRTKGTCTQFSNAQFSSAAEACFSMEEHMHLIGERLHRLQQVEDKEAQVWVRELAAFWTEHEEVLRNQIKGMGYDAAQALENDKRILSPSDVGFHNILKTKSGELVFIDFEYFGWDDSVKMLCDFLLEPGVPCPDAVKASAVKDFSEKFEWTQDDRQRFKFLYPILAFKWCLILLNVFLPSHRKKSAGNVTLDAAGQLRKSRAFFQTLTQALKTREYEAWVNLA